jgi:glycerol-3-phosphate O-acyltransferase
VDNLNASDPNLGHRPWYLALLGRWLKPLVRIQRLTPESDKPPFDPGKPVLYILEQSGLSHLLILDQACREAGWPRPLAPLPLKNSRARFRSYFALQRGSGRKPSERVEKLTNLLTALHLEPDSDVQVVPVSVLVGRAPDRQSGWFKVLFSENWEVVGRLRRFIAVLFNGRNTIVQISAPVELRGALPEPVNLKAGARKLFRVLRVHFRRIRAALVGPDLSHRRTLAESILYAPDVRAAIAATSAKEKISLFQTTERARRYFWEIAADYSHPVVRSLSFMLTWFWNQIYAGVRIHHFDTVLKIAPGNEIVYVPCHRSHIDYLLLSYLLYQQGIVPPHIAAGVNLNLPVVGPLLRRGGAFFLRRSFKSNALYAAVFNEYVSELIARGFSIEYFVEGGRSRTGRLLQPRAGMLAMTVRSFLRNPQRPVIFQPVYVGYEKLIEGKSYIGELSGRKKEKESLFGLLRSFSILKEKYGHVAVNFGEPIALNDVLSAADPNWRQFDFNGDARPGWLPGAIDQLADQVLININRAADVNPICLLGMALLGTPKHAMGEEDLVRILTLAKDLLRDLPYSDRVTVTELSPADIIAHGESMKWIARVKHPLGDILRVEGDLGVLISYFRNNVLHLFSAIAWVAVCFLNNRRMPQNAVIKLGQAVYPYLKTELFLPWTVEEFGARIEATIRLFVRYELLGEEAGSAFITRPGDGTEGLFGVRVLAHGLLQTFQRYYIVLSVLAKNGPGVLSAGELENVCHLTAQRIALLHELSGPEFFDKALFKSFIQMLRERNAVTNDAHNKLIFGDELVQLGNDARLVLSRELRDGITKVTPEAHAKLLTTAKDT